jgi:hypothetical protein
VAVLEKAVLTAYGNGYTSAFSIYRTVLEQSSPFMEMAGKQSFNL